ncbi:hypothetical protein CB0940_05375 [Cercospora beticola]|uniref:Uncharacterized protein n=1 Tax=Cercospora beticola TaxID=122368 RepID=A0A2G5HZJ0_CERBT|nr:hypothetical protein CB0940_05375 [Cercospora beticola]PIA97959.1 hypothetical protein CB0940_05375 [Cercospora beticola]WPA97915.1 hypothetical protein RHO25_002526 [Cercospora beticola]CAK1359115.1 unnamed protein product [Cercospora beticola]
MTSPTTAQSSRRPSWQYKYEHEMSDEERLESLKAWAEEKKYVTPGEEGTLSTGIGGVTSLALGGPLRTVQSARHAEDKYHGQYDAPIGPPSYKVATTEEQERKPNVLKRWLQKRRLKKAAKRSESAPEYVR